jgi:hypothetical protein
MSSPSMGVSDDDELVNVTASLQKTPSLVFSEKKPKVTISEEDETNEQLRLRLDREEVESL